jgi:hypothetical protein
VLSWDSAASNYPSATVKTNFAAAAAGNLQAGTLPVTTLTYKTTATLLSMQNFTSFDGSPATIQTWEIRSTGSLTNSPKATVEVVAVVETPKIPAYSYAAFATDTACGALTFGGNATTNSYDPNVMDPANPAKPKIDDESADVGTNGNLAISGHVDVFGNLYSPRAGVGACTEGNVTALTESGGATVHGDSGNDIPIQLPKAISFPTPVVPAFSATPAVELTNGGVAATTCLALGLVVGVNCNVAGDTITLNGNGTELHLPEVTLKANMKLVLVAGGPPASKYDFNSLTLDGQATVGISATSPAEGVVVNIVGKDNTGADITSKPVLDLQGGGFVAVTGCATCSVYDASMLQFIYGGSGTVKMAGNSAAAAVLYAPNADATLVGTNDLYGSIIAKRLTLPGTADIHYDRELQKEFFIAGQPMLGTFTWRRF